MPKSPPSQTRCLTLGPCCAKIPHASAWNLFCRLCGRIFCYYCSNNYVTTKHSGKKERCCRECYSQHGDVVERFTQAELGPAEAQSPPPAAGAGPASHPQPAPYKPTPRVTGDSQGAVYTTLTPFTSVLVIQHTPFTSVYWLYNTHRSPVCTGYTTHTVHQCVPVIQHTPFTSVYCVYHTHTDQEITRDVNHST